jgi:hypothetical protein
MPARVSADTGGVHARLLVVSLALAALGSLAIAGLRIADANRGHREGSEVPAREYRTTAAVAAATRAKLRPPSGFQRSHECPVDPETVCFQRSKSLLLSTRVVERLLAQTGATLNAPNGVLHSEPLLPINCSTAGLPVRARLAGGVSFQSCQAGALIGEERLMVFVRSSIAVVHGSPRSTKLTARGFAFPTELQAHVLGH